MTVLQDKTNAIKSDTTISSKVRAWAYEVVSRIERSHDAEAALTARLDAVEARLKALEDKPSPPTPTPVPDPVPVPLPPPVDPTQKIVQLSATLPYLTPVSNTRYVGPCVIKGTVTFSGGVTNVTIDNVEITNPTDDAIRMMNCSKITLSNLNVHDAESGIFADGSAFVKADDVTIQNCKFTNLKSLINGDVGIGIQSCGKRWHVTDTLIQFAAQQGALLDASTGKGASDFLFERCKFLDNGWGTYDGGNHGVYAKAPNCVFIECEASGNDKNGFSLRWAGAKVIRCYTKPRAHPQPIDVAWFGYATSTPGQVYIEDNDFNGATDAGIYIDGGGPGGTFHINRNHITGASTQTAGINTDLPVAEHVGNTFSSPIGTHESYA